MRILFIASVLWGLVFIAARSPLIFCQPKQSSFSSRVRQSSGCSLRSWAL